MLSSCRNYKDLTIRIVEVNVCTNNYSYNNVQSIQLGHH